MTHVFARRVFFCPILRILATHVKRVFAAFAVNVTRRKAFVAIARLIIVAFVIVATFVFCHVTVLVTVV